MWQSIAIDVSILLKPKDGVLMPISMTSRMYRAFNRVTFDLQLGWQAQNDVQQHARLCPMGRRISIQDGSDFWHCEEHCEILYDSRREVRTYDFCRVYSRVDLIDPGADDEDAEMD